MGVPLPLHRAKQSRAFVRRNIEPHLHPRLNGTSKQLSEQVCRLARAIKACRPGAETELCPKTARTPSEPCVPSHVPPH